MEKILRHILHIMTAVLLCCGMLCGCGENDLDLEFRHPASGHVNTGTPASRPPTSEFRKVLLLYSCGFNSLSGYLKEDIDDLLKGDVPGCGGGNDVVLIFGQHVATTYANLTEPVLIQAYNDGTAVVRDTIKIWPAGTVSADSGTLKEVLNYVKNYYPAKEYSLLFSSHATGWLPAGYYSNRSSDYTFVPRNAPRRRVAAPGEPLTKDSREPLTKTLGETLVGSTGAYTSYTMNLTNFAKAFPMKMESIMFDCCMMGCIEVAYELKDVCNSIVFSPAEILADGFDYKQLTGHFFAGRKGNAQAVAEDYIAQYLAKTGTNRSATISMVDCRYLEDLAAVCRNIYSAHYDAFQSLSGKGVQQYFRYDFTYFYDLRDVIVKAGASESELKDFDEAIARCVPFKGCTESFLPSYGGFYITTYSGLSCYLPSMGDAGCRSIYKTLSWNAATGYVK